MDCFTDPKVEKIVMMTGVQVGKSEFLNNCILYFMVADPASIMMTQPRESDARKYSLSRLKPMFRDSPICKGLVKPPKARDSENTILQMNGDGWRLVLTGTQSPRGVRGDPIRILLMDELDASLVSNAEGDVQELATARTTTFSNRKVALVSTPTDEETSRIKQAYDASDQRVYLVPCPSCTELQTLRWANVRWEKDSEGNHLPATAKYYCEHCGVEWTESERHQAVRQGQWRATAEFNGTAGFHLNGLYAPWANLSLPKLAEKWVNATSGGGKPHLLRTFTNTILAECWSESYQSLDTTGLAERIEKYPEENGVTVIPAQVVVLCAGVDVQADRIECSVVGHGRADEQWVIEHVVFAGSPGEKDVWNQLWEYLTRPWQIEKRGEEYIRATCVDTGFHTQAAYDFCRARYRYPTPDGRRGMLFAIRGQAGGSGGDIWPRKPLRSKTAKTPVFGIRVEPAKEVLFSSITKIVAPGPGYIHFPERLPQDYFKQLTAERVVTRYDARGFPKRVWELKGQGRRNECLDTFVYQYAAKCALEAGGMVVDREAERMDAWLAAAEQETPVSPSPATPASVPPSPGSAEHNPGTAVSPRQQKISRSNYLGR
tara:strand:+ start:552 stop:2360 length:1809 start_codon:yes stop_codon:yes gene_type:complete